MGLRKLLFVVIASLALESCVADYETSGKNLSWIYDIKNAATTQNQTYRLDTDTGAFRYHFDVSAVDSYKFETMSNDAVTMGCYGWKDLDNRWHGTNYVADSHGRRDVRDISKPVDVYPTENEHTTRTFLDNLPQCLAFVLDTPPLMVYVFTNHPPTKPTPAGTGRNDHIPHSSEQVHKVHKGKAPAYSGIPTTGPNQLQYEKKSPQVDLKVQGSPPGPSTDGFDGPSKAPSRGRRPETKTQHTEDLVAEVTSLSPTRASHRTVKGRQDLSRGSRKYATGLPISVTPSGITGDVSGPISQPSSLSPYEAIPTEDGPQKPELKDPLGLDKPEFPGFLTPTAATSDISNRPFGNTLEPDSELKTDAASTPPTDLDSFKGTFKLSTPSIGTLLGSPPTAAGQLDLPEGSLKVVTGQTSFGTPLGSPPTAAGRLDLPEGSLKVVSGQTSFGTSLSSPPTAAVVSKGTATAASKFETGSTASETPPGSPPTAEGPSDTSEGGFLNIFDTTAFGDTFETSEVPTTTSVDVGKTGLSYEKTKFGQGSDLPPLRTVPTAESPSDLIETGQRTPSKSRLPSARPITETPSSSIGLTKGRTSRPDSDLKTEIFTFSPAAPTPDSSKGVLITSSITSGGTVTGTASVPIESGEGISGLNFERTKAKPDSGSKVIDLPTIPTTGSTVSDSLPVKPISQTPIGPTSGTFGDRKESQPFDRTPLSNEVLVSSSPTDLKNDPTDASKFGSPSGFTITSFTDRVPVAAPEATKPTFVTDSGSLKTVPTTRYISQPTYPTPSRSNQVSTGPGSQINFVSSQTPGATIPTPDGQGGLSIPPFVGTTIRPVTDLPIDVSAFVPTSSTQSGSSKPGQQITFRPDIPATVDTTGSRVTSFEDRTPSRHAGSRFPIDVALFSPHKPPTDLTESTSVTGLPPGPTVPTFDERSSYRPGGELHLSSLLPPSSTPSTLGGHRDFAAFTTRYDKPAEYGPYSHVPTTTSGLLRTATAEYLPPLDGNGPGCSCVCPRG